MKGSMHKLICSDFPVHLGSAIKVMRIARRLTQVELAASMTKLLGKTVTQSYVSKIESGASPGSFRRLGLFCIAMRCMPREVISVAEQLTRSSSQDEKSLAAELDRHVTRRLKDQDEESLTADLDRQATRKRKKKRSPSFNHIR